LADEGQVTDGRARVLVIDDEPMIVKAVWRLLSRDHDVTCCEGAARALELVRGGASYDVILCDMTMPEMGGAAFYEQLEKIAPALTSRVVLMTGDASSVPARAFLARVPNQRIEKPFEVAKLRSVVARSLSSGRT
jgi:CheY-like chemotaxis protein